MAADRAFTHPDRTAEDLAALAAIRSALVARRPAGRDRWRDREGAQHWVVVPDRERLLATAPAVAVGFFGQARDDVDHEPIVALEHDLLDRAERFAGLLAYHNVRFASGQWGNLVVFADESSPGNLREDAVHDEAVARTPRHYHSLRLHRLALPGGLLGEQPLVLLRTGYFDFREDPPWRSVRSPAPRSSSG